MRVQASVKKICRKCKIIRRKRRGARDLRTIRATNSGKAEVGLSEAHRLDIIRGFISLEHPWPGLLG